MLLGPPPSGDLLTEIVLPQNRPISRGRGFSLVELLVVITIIAIIAAIATPLVPGLLRADQLDSNTNTLAGILDEARESAMANNTSIWVAFATAPTAAGGTWVATIQSQDGTETGVISGTTWATTITVPGVTANLILHSKLQNLPGVKLVALSTLSSVPSLTTAGNANIPASAYDLVLTEGALNLKWTIATSGAAGLGATFFTYAIEFTPNGEAHVPTWNSNTQFGLVPTIGLTSPPKNAILFNVSRLTGKATIFRM